MSIFFLYFTVMFKCTFSALIIEKAGIYNIESDDIAMIIYLTVENSFNNDIRISVKCIKCIQGAPYLDTADHMYVIGGDMGTIRSKRATNISLIYPNLYLRNLIGKCLITLHFATEEGVQETKKEVTFESNKAMKNLPDQQCTSYDFDEQLSCLPVDCVVKYSARRSYFNKERRICQPVPQCPPNAVYIPKSNACRKIHIPVCKSDLEMIEDGYIEKRHPVSNVVNYRCHHGMLLNTTGECVCNDGWTTQICSSGSYHPTLNLYHMCNVQLNTWEQANRKKMMMTVLVLMILAGAIAAKMLLAVCLLNWCCHFFRAKSKHSMDDEDDSFCEDEECPSGDMSRSSRTIRVSFSNIDTVSEGAESDVTVDVEERSGDRSEKSESKSETLDSKRSSLSICRCKPK